MPSYDFAIRIQPISKDEFLHSGYVRNGDQLKDIEPQVCRYQSFFTAGAYDDHFRGLIGADSNKPGPWDAHPNAHENGFHSGWTNIDEVEHRFAEMAEPSRRRRLSQSRREDNAKILTRYGIWLCDALILGGRHSGQNDLSQLFDTCKNAALGNGGVFRLLLELSHSAEQPKCDDAHLRLRQLSSLTYELIGQTGTQLLRHAFRTLYRVNCIDAFLKDETATARCRAPRAYIGVAGPDDDRNGLPTLSLLEWFSQLEELAPRAGRLDLGFGGAAAENRFILPGTLDMQFSQTTINGIDPVGHRELVAIIAHGRSPQPGAERVLLLNAGHLDQPSLEVEIGIGAIGEFLALCRARLAIVACCQGRNPNSTEFNDLGLRLFQTSLRLFQTNPEGLSAIVCFRAEVAVRTVTAFMKAVAEKLREAGPDNPFQLMRALASAQSAITVVHGANPVDNGHWDYVIPAFYVRQELELQLPKPPEERWVPLPPNNAFFGQRREIAMYPVTREEFRTYLSSLHDNFVDPWADDPYHDDDDLPATRLTWDEIQEFISWINQNDESDEGWQYCLPCPFEWLRAAFGVGDLKDVPKYPWGDDWDPQKANTTGMLISVFETWPNESEAYGMAGNCWEIIASNTFPQEPFRLMGGDCRSDAEKCSRHYSQPAEIAIVNEQATGHNLEALEIGFRLIRWFVDRPD